MKVYKFLIGYHLPFRVRELSPHAGEEIFFPILERILKLAIPLHFQITSKCIFPKSINIQYIDINIRIALIYSI